MVTQKEKLFFLDTARRASTLSDSDSRKGAVLVKNNKILSIGYSRKIIKDQKWEISAIYDAIFTARDTDLSEAFIFSTHFPKIDDIKLIIATGILKVYFCNKIDDSETVELMNSFQQNLIPLELIQLE